jgi:hypothetical protein
MRFDSEKEKADTLAVIEAARALINALMPGVRHIALQDYAALNLTPIRLAGLHGAMLKVGIVDPYKGIAETLQRIEHEDADTAAAADWANEGNPHA